MLDIAGQVAGRAGRGKGAGHREQHRLPAIEQRMGVQRLHALADALEGDFGNAVANVDGHGSSWVKGRVVRGVGGRRQNVETSLFIPISTVADARGDCIAQDHSFDHGSGAASR
ncbi:hypothetical protein D9M71_725390 [compost metagenome]